MQKPKWHIRSYEDLTALEKIVTLIPAIPLAAAPTYLFPNIWFIVVVPLFLFYIGLLAVLYHFRLEPDSHDRDTTR